MREWLVKKQLIDGYFFNLPEKTPRKMPHFTRELLLVTYAVGTDEFSVLLQGGF